MDAWIFSGHTNADAPASITGEKGMALTCRNFAWTEQSGFDGQGFLVFDGVDDYLVNENMELLDDFTVIVDRTLLKRVNTCTAAKSLKVGLGAFILEVREGTGNFSVYSYNNYSCADGSTVADGVTWMTPTSYNGTAIARGQAADTPLMTIGTTRHNDTRFFKGTIKWFALYRRTLSQEEITAEIGKLTSLWESRKV